MAINPGGRRNDEDMWAHGAHQRSDSVSGSSGEYGSVGKAKKGLAARVRNAAQCLFGKTPSEPRSPMPTEPTLGHTVSGYDARGDEGAARGLMKKGYTPGKKIPTPTAPKLATPVSGAASKPAVSAPAPKPLPKPPVASKPAHMKGKAPQPPVSQTAKKRMAPQPPVKPGKKMVSPELQSKLEVFGQKRSERAQELVSSLQNRWEQLEQEDPIVYQLSGLSTLANLLDGVRSQVQARNEGSPEQGRKDPTVQHGLGLVQTACEVGRKERQQEGSSSILPVLVTFLAEGPTLSASVDPTLFMQSLIEKHIENPEDFDQRGLLGEIADTVRNLRAKGKGLEDKFWGSAAGRTSVAMRTLYSESLAGNAGTGVNTDRVRRNTEENVKTMNGLKHLDAGLFGNAVGVLASDVC